MTSRGGDGLGLPDGDVTESMFSSAFSGQGASNGAVGGDHDSDMSVTGEVSKGSGVGSLTGEAWSSTIPIEIFLLTLDTPQHSWNWPVNWPIRPPK